MEILKNIRTSAYYSRPVVAPAIPARNNPTFDRYYIGGEVFGRYRAIVLVLNRRTPWSREFSIEFINGAALSS